MQTTSAIVSHQRQIVVGALVQQVISLVILLVVARSLGASSYGVVATALAWASSIYNFGAFWTSPYIVRFGAKQAAQHGRVGDTFLWAGAISLGCTAAVFAVTTGMNLASEVTANIGTGILAGLVLGTLLLNLLRQGLQAAQSFRQYGLLLWFDKALLAASVAWLVLAESLDHTTVIAATALCTLLTAGGGLYYFICTHVSWRIRSFSSREFVDMSAPTFVATLLNYFSSAPFVILAAGHVLDMTSAGLLSIGFLVCGLMAQPVGWLTPTLLPKLTIALDKGEHSELRAHFIRIVLPLVLLFAVGTLAFFLIKPLLPALLGSDFAEAGLLTSALLTAYLAEAIHIVVVPLLFAAGKQFVVLMGASIRSAVFVLSVSALSDGGLEMFLAGIAGGYWLCAVVELWAIRQYSTPRFHRLLVLAAAAVTLPPFLEFAGMPGLASLSAWSALAVLLGLSASWYGTWCKNLLSRARRPAQ